MRTKKNEQGEIIGVDLGTGEILAVWVKNGTLICLDSTGFSMPSDILFDEDGTVLVGRTARNMARLFPDRHCSDYKRYMGQKEPVLVLPEKSYLAEEMAEIALKETFSRVCQTLGTNHVGVVITCPAYFDNHQRSCLRKATENAGFEYVGMVDEPVAASVSSGSKQTPGTISLIADLGAGTCDVTLVKWIGVNTVQVLAKRGDRDLAGNDIERAIIQEAVKRAEADLGSPIDLGDLATRQELADLAALCREAKHNLSERNKATLVYTLGGKRHTWEITREAFNGLIADILSGIRAIIQQTLDDAGLQPDGVNETVVVGGTSRVPAVREHIAEMMGQTLACKGNPQEAVVRGAALLAPGFMKDKGGEMAEMANGLPSVAVKNILGYALSIAVVKNKTDHSLVAREMISRAVELPAKAERHFQPVEDGQTGVRVLLVPVQEGTDITDSMAIGTIKLDIPARHGAQNQERILVRVEVDKSSLIRVYSKDRESGTEKELELTYEEASHASA